MFLDSHLVYSLNYLIIPCATFDKASDNMIKDQEVHFAAKHNESTVEFAGAGSRHLMYEM